MERQLEIDCMSCTSNIAFFPFQFLYYFVLTFLCVFATFDCKLSKRRRITCSFQTTRSINLICVLFMFTFLCLYVRGISGPFQASSKMESSNAPSQMFDRVLYAHVYIHLYMYLYIQIAYICIILLSCGNYSGLWFAEISENYICVIFMHVITVKILGQTRTKRKQLQSEAATGGAL